jgi:hypothetical protein
MSLATVAPSPVAAFGSFRLAGWPVVAAEDPGYRAAKRFGTSGRLGRAPSMTTVKMTTVKKPYEAPKLVELGSLHALTLQVKVGPSCDITCFHNTSSSARD